MHGASNTRNQPRANLAQLYFKLNQRHALNRDPMHQAAVLVTLIDRVMPRRFTTFYLPLTSFPVSLCRLG